MLEKNRLIPCRIGSQFSQDTPCSNRGTFANLRRGSSS
ncbi:hypothetical protein HAT2_00344 [Candidatus Similichlamydia laticola]|uniref:Uncharacterized protein n=1 Tax=Candidatus Similichlamydia laticola TaxID=2170265 RepID=A0A369KAB5_9BACT|nr:hypothetical protein HAT2_00344 [Candidatus Similichlamydia laticola]